MKRKIHGVLFAPTITAALTSALLTPLAAPLVHIAQTLIERGKLPKGALPPSDPAAFVPWCLARDGRLLSGGHWQPFLIAIAVIFFVVAFLFVYERAKNPRREIANGILGSQRAITAQSEIAKACKCWDGKNEPVGGVALGFVKAKEVLFECKHAVICAPSGSGKTRGSVYPTIDALSFSGENNLIITDPSLEIYVTTHRLLEERGYDVLLLDLENPRQGARFNPLRLVSDLHEIGDEAAAEARSREIGTTLYPLHGTEADVFASGAGGAFSAAAHEVATLAGLPEDQRTLWSTVKTIYTGTANKDTEPFKDWLRGFGEDSPAFSMASTFLSSQGKMESSILSSLEDGLKPFSSLNMRWATSGSEIEIDRMIRGKTVLFIHTLAPGREENRLASLLLAQHWAEVQRLGKRRGLRPTWGIFDEFHSLPPFGLVHALEQGRKYGVHYIMYVQSLSGFDLYRTPKEDGKDAILANCDVKALYRAGSDKDAQYFETQSGFRTVRVENTGEQSSPSGKGSSRGYGEQKVPVWPMGDILERDPGKDGVLVVQAAGHDRPAGKYEVPMADPTETFVAEHMGTLGTREFEQAVMNRELDALESRAAGIKLEVGGWTPDYGQAEKGPVGRPQDDIDSDEHDAWD